MITIILLSFASYVYFAEGSQTPTTTTTETFAATTSVAAATSQVPVGVVYYLWYGNATTGTGGLGSPGWNASDYPGGGAVEDRPNLGFYVSDSNDTFQTQIDEMQGAGISFAVVSWWGPSTRGEAGAINRATHDLFRYLQRTNSAFKIAILVDAYESGHNLNGSTLAGDYDYVYSRFASAYSQWYFDWKGHPLLLFFNPIYPLYNDTRFAVRTVGNHPNRVDWLWWDAPESFFQGEGGSGVNASNDFGTPVISPDGEVTLVPRIDSYYGYASGYSSGYLRFDANLSEGLYNEQWGYVMNNRPLVKLVLIYGWNEFHERTAVEPIDGTSYLLNETSSFISMLRSGS